MQLTRTISTVEMHTGGEPFRIVTSGLPKLPGQTIVERRAWLLQNADEIRRALMFEPRGHDRSPTGSGTAGRVAQLYLRGRLGRDGVLVNESVIGTVFTGRVLGETDVGGIPAVIPEVAGSAHVCGLGTWILDERDPLRHGFLVR